MSVNLQSMGQTVCKSKSGPVFNLTINVLIHVLILFAILSVFFFFYISKLEKQVFEKEIKKLMDENEEKLLNQIDSDTKGASKKTLQSLKPGLDVLQRMYDRPSEKLQIYNRWLVKTDVLALVIVLITIIAIIASIYFNCGTCIPLWDIIKENIVIFIFIGIVEYMFFTKVASQYVPAPPSLLASSFFESAKRHLGNGTTLKSRVKDKLSKLRHAAMH